MKDLVIGVHVQHRDARSALEGIVEAEAAGIGTAWMTCSVLTPDPLAVFAAAAEHTNRIGLGTCIMPVFPRHPLALAQSAAVVESFAPGRLRLGIGPSHERTVNEAYGLEFLRPLEYLREYVEILTSLFANGRVDFRGRRLIAEGELPAPLRLPIPIFMSALRHNAYVLAGEVADGGISWITPPEHIRDVALPALREGAARAGRTGAVPAIVHQPVVVSTDAQAAWDLAKIQFGRHLRFPYYSRMWVDAGYEEAGLGTLSRRMFDAIVIHGDEQTVADRVRRLPSFGAAELIATPLVLTNDPQSLPRTIALLGDLAKSD